MNILNIMFWVWWWWVALGLSTVLFLLHYWRRREGTRARYENRWHELTVLVMALALAVTTGPILILMHVLALKFPQLNESS